MAARKGASSSGVNRHRADIQECWVNANSK